MYHSVRHYSMDAAPVSFIVFHEMDRMCGRGQAVQTVRRARDERQKQATNREKQDHRKRKQCSAQQADADVEGAATEEGTAGSKRRRLSESLVMNTGTVDIILTHTRTVRTDNTQQIAVASSHSPKTLSLSPHPHYCCLGTSRAANVLTSIG